MEYAQNSFFMQTGAVTGGCTRHCNQKRGRNKYMNIAVWGQENLVDMSESD